MMCSVGYTVPCDSIGCLAYDGTLLALYFNVVECSLYLACLHSFNQMRNDNEYRDNDVEYS